MEIVADSRCFEGRQLRYAHYSDSCQCLMNFSLYLPPLAEKQNVPLLTWLSGLTCTDENFVHKAGAQQFAAREGVAILAPDTSPRGDNIPNDPEQAWDFGLGAGFYVNATQAPWHEHYQMYSYITDELPALLAKSDLSLDLDRQGLFGHSMGGHGALTIALKNPDIYQSVSAFAPICSPINCPWGQKALGQYLGENQQSWSEYDACQLLLKSEKHLPILIDQGTEDSFLSSQLKPDLFQQACDTTNTELKLRMQDGYDHSYFFIASFIEDHIMFHVDKLF